MIFEPSEPERVSGSPGSRDNSGTADLHDLSAEIVKLLHEQAFGPGEVRTESEICASFAEMLLRYWDLCCIVTFLSDEGRLQPSSSYFQTRVNEEEALRAASLLAAEVEQQGEERQIWASDGPDDRLDEEEMRQRFLRSTLKAGAGVPIFAHGELAGVIVVASSKPEVLSAALVGVRFVAPAIIIAIGNARRGVAVNEQHGRIDALVEELKRRTVALEAANRELQRVGRYRSLFLARMSHELRTPLTSILGFGEILLDQEDLTEPQRRFCEKIQASGLQLQASLNQLVDLSRIEAGQTELFLHEFSLRETLRESCAAVGRLAKKHDVRLECQPGIDVGNVVSDEGKLRQVFYNFLSHAIGRSSTGGSVRVRTSTLDDARVVVEISDEGESLADPSHLFEPVDVDAPSERGTNMNELGLVIAYRLLTVLGGSVALHDVDPQGLAVTLSLPTRPTET
jgi:signal transduction histidine kinase